MRVAYQGARGAYSEAALRQQFGARAAALPCALSEHVFDAVETGAADRGILPVENTIVGNVDVNADLFLRRKVFVIRESFLKIEHCLLAAPSARLRDLKTVYSHPVALAQCRDFIRARRLKALPEYDTAGAAELVAKRATPDAAAIASSLCAEAYGLKILRKNIQSYRNNITRFLTFVRQDRIPSRVKMEKTSLAFSTRHRPGALLSCLQSLAEHRINLTRLESRPIPENPFEYFFYVDFIGGMNDAEVSGALRALRRDARRVKIIGSYPIAAR
ncbi:MAG: prephenate dehydratase [Elusimicrobia bacterium]|nr:prephenate dehydratase [Elusimicrobiota bacterium]